MKTFNDTVASQTVICTINMMCDAIGRKRLGFEWLLNLSLHELRRIQYELLDEYNKAVTKD